MQINGSLIYLYQFFRGGKWMRIQILGTAAAEAWPAVFCGCETCTRARTAGGKNIRSRASIQIDDIYKIDISPDTYYQMVRDGLDLSALAHLFITHSHSDHFALDEMEFFAEPYAHNLKNAPIKVYGNDAVVSAIKLRYPESTLPIELTALKSFIPVEAGDLTFTPVVASHMSSEECLNYVVQSDSATVLYASDTGTYAQPTIDFLSALKFDLLIIECTYGTLDLPAAGHMTFPSVLQLRDTLKAQGAISADTPVVITHFSHNIGLLHDEFEAIANPENIAVAYDGMVIEI